MGVIIVWVIVLLWWLYWDNLLDIHWAYKKLITSWVTLTEIHNIKMNNTPNNAHLKKPEVTFAKKDENAVKSQRVLYRKLQKWLTVHHTQKNSIQIVQ